MDEKRYSWMKMGDVWWLIGWVGSDGWMDRCVTEWAGKHGWIDG